MLAVRGRRQKGAAWIDSIDGVDGVSRCSLDHFIVFVAVAECGGFAAASRKLGRAQSAVTHSIRRMEEACGLLLFDRSGYRAELTEAGRALLVRARRVIEELKSFEREAGAFAKGLEAGLSVALDPFVAQAPLAGVLRELHAAYPQVTLTLSVVPRAQVLEWVASGRAQLGAVSDTAPLGAAFEALRWGEHRLVAVAAPAHPLARHDGALPAEALRGHMQVVWTPGEAGGGEAGTGVPAGERWQVSSLHAKRELLLAAAGWGSLPDHLVAEDLTAGRLVRLPIETCAGRQSLPAFGTAVIRRRGAVAGPALRRLLELLRAAAAIPQGAASP
ncbi:LysR family transcriptional regulator [Rubrivivax gelatinosus]|uniref:LysR family transcriptional regulator n=1 Tax=Rubrivivax gelatinosus TaxID=28068 RepID=A0A4R2M6I2_RUBGE|nr:LysR family transcriptional regulator [Rubrivivax gelatinosus]MBK1688795.1 hypothetical protein [Rubrivivax gelatinosus]TCP02879.1 LysR family transcriptional regulator [Rubrivivax gelatinosus]